MGNVMDYLDWRGDLSFAVSPICEADKLVFACLSYVKLDGIVPGIREGEISLQEAAKKFDERNTDEVLEKDRSFIREMPKLFMKAAVTARYEELTLKNYVSVTDPVRELQFSAVEIGLPDGHSFLSFRGTDDTIVGWREDFKLSTGVVDAQREAVNYVNCVFGEGISLDRSNQIYFGGHSKGGNLAEYAAAMCEPEVQDHIVQVLNFDGPGFDRVFLKSPEYQRIASRVHFFIPGFSIIGMLLNHEREPVIVESSEHSAMAHAALTWQILGTRFVRCAALEPPAEYFHSSLSSWIDGVTAKERESFIEDFFGVLEASGARTLTDLRDIGVKGTNAMLQRLEKVTPETKKTIWALLTSLLAELTNIIAEAAQTSIKELITTSANQLVDQLDQLAEKNMGEELMKWLGKVGKASDAEDPQSKTLSLETPEE